MPWVIGHLANRSIKEKRGKSGGRKIREECQVILALRKLFHVENQRLPRKNQQYSSKSGEYEINEFDKRDTDYKTWRVSTNRSTSRTLPIAISMNGERPGASVSQA